jgi:hypothetical protein
VEVAAEAGVVVVAATSATHPNATAAIRVDFTKSLSERKRNSGVGKFRSAAYRFFRMSNKVKMRQRLDVS